MPVPTRGWLWPNFSLALGNLGSLHIYTGEPTKAIPFYERAMRLDPAAQHGQTRGRESCPASRSLIDFYPGNLFRGFYGSV